MLSTEYPLKGRRLTSGRYCCAF